jgi:Carboxylesterase family
MLKAPAIESKEFEIIKKMVSIVTSFIINGNPNNNPDIENIAWKPATNESPLMCLNISNDSIKMIELPEKARMKVWDEILEDAGVPLY